LEICPVISEKKTLQTTIGSIEIAVTNPFSNYTNGFRMSSLLQDIFCYVGQLNVYEKSTGILDKLLGIKTSSVQVNKVADCYGKKVTKDDYLLHPTLSNIPSKEKVYVEMDGSMISIRKDKQNANSKAGWKEIKVARIFRESDCMDIEGKPSYIKHSQYLAQFTDSQTFTKQIDTLLDNYALDPSQLIFINDGATWIKNYIEDAFPSATSILDLYHAKEHLYSFAKEAISCEKERKKWAITQCDLIEESKIEMVVKNITEIGIKNTCSEQAKILCTYYQNNIKRMNYTLFRTMGAGIVGSGAIESAHRTVVQSRCKLSGQHWSEKGIQNMLNLKTVYLNEDWKKIVQISKYKAA
jgi:Uncharacterised protein family (UPF0236)